jgi:hypothetical protein
MCSVLNTIINQYLLFDRTSKVKPGKPALLRRCLVHRRSRCGRHVFLVTAFGGEGSGFWVQERSNFPNLIAGRPKIVHAAGWTELWPLLSLIA